MVAASTLLGLAIAPRWGNAAVRPSLLPAVIATAIFAGRSPALIAALISRRLLYQFLLHGATLTFRINNPNDIATVLVLLAVAVVTSHLASSVRKQAQRGGSAR
jgi:two-component system sensor histidine kinase KdpD